MSTDTSAAAVVDRGDDFTPPAAPAPETPPAVETPKEETPPAAETPKEETPPAPETPPAEEPPRDDKGRFIPKAEFDKRLERERTAREAAESRVAEMEARMGQIKTTESIQQMENQARDLRKELRKAIYDGNEDKAEDVQNKLSTLERQIAVSEAAIYTTQNSAEVREQVRLDMTIDRLEAEFEIMNPDSDVYDQDVVNDVLGWQEVFMNRDKMPASLALDKAARKVMESLAPPPPPTPPEEVKEKGLSAGQTAVVARGTEQVAKNIEAAASQPPGMDDVGKDTDKAGMKEQVDVSKLSQEEFAALPEATKAKLRGDLL